MRATSPEHLDGAVRNDLVHLVRARARVARGREEVGFEVIAALTFMLVCVPLPVWKTTSGKWSASVPAMTCGRWARTEGRTVVSTQRRTASGHGRLELAPSGFERW